MYFSLSSIICAVATEHDIKLRRAKTFSISVSLAVYTVSITQEKLIERASVWMKEQTNKAINKRNGAVGYRGTRENTADYYFEIKSLEGRLYGVLDEQFPYLFYTVWITTNCAQFWKRWDYQITWPASWEICMQVKKQQLGLDMEQQTGSKSGKEYIKAVYCHPTSLTSKQSTSWEMQGWIKHKLESRLLGEISIIPDTQMTPLLW